MVCQQLWTYSAQWPTKLRRRARKVRSSIRMRAYDHFVAQRLSKTNFVCLHETEICVVSPFLTIRFGHWPALTLDHLRSCDYRYIPVDIYGKCSNLSCARDGRCWQMLGQKYKFYLAFENSNCKDYITEKLFWNAFE
jgi:hypothetical protein